MARSSDPDSASSQFFICYEDCSSDLDGSYAAFGLVVEGMEVADAIVSVPTTSKGMHRDVPQENIVILDVVEE